MADAVDRLTHALTMSALDGSVRVRADDLVSVMRRAATAPAVGAPAHGLVENGNDQDEHCDLLEIAWGVIANAGGWPNTSAPSPGWLEAAERWRERWFDLLRIHCAPGDRATDAAAQLGDADARARFLAEADCPAGDDTAPPQDVYAVVMRELDRLITPAGTTAERYMQAESVVRAIDAYRAAAGPRAGDTAPTDKSNEIGANVLRDHAGRLVPVAEFDEVLTFRAGKGITHSFHSSVVRDLLIECHTIRSEHDRLRARVAELEGVGNALAEKAQTDARVPTVHSAEALADAAVAWRSAAGAPTTAAPAAAFTDGTVPAERPLPERPWRVMADWDTVIGPFRTRGEAEYWRDRSRVAHHPNAYVEPEWAPPRAAPASDKEEAERLRWIVGRVWLALELWPGSPENAPPDHEIPGVVASLVAEAAAPTDGQAPADARPRVAVLRSDLESWFGTLEQAARETAGPLSIELAAMSGEVGYWRQQKLVAAPADDTAPWGPVTIVRRDLPADCDDTVEPDTGPAGLGWRVGRSVGRTVYAPDDELIGVMDTPDLALRVVEAVNGDLSETSYEIRAERDGLRETLAAERQRSGDLVAELRRQVAALERPVPRAGQFVRDSQDGGA